MLATKFRVTGTELSTDGRWDVYFMRVLSSTQCDGSSAITITSSSICNQQQQCTASCAQCVAASGIFGCDNCVSGSPCFCFSSIYGPQSPLTRKPYLPVSGTCVAA